MPNGHLACICAHAPSIEDHSQPNLFYFSTPCTDPWGVGQKHAAPAGPGGRAQHQKVGVEQMVPGVCGGICAIASVVLPNTMQITMTVDVRNRIMGPSRLASSHRLF
jgi:hypothetical protein